MCQSARSLALLTADARPALAGLLEFLLRELGCLTQPPPSFTSTPIPTHITPATTATAAAAATAPSTTRAKRSVVAKAKRASKKTKGDEAIAAEVEVEAEEKSAEQKMRVQLSSVSQADALSEELVHMLLSCMEHSNSDNSDGPTPTSDSGGFFLFFVHFCVFFCVFYLAVLGSCQARDRRTGVLGCLTFARPGLASCGLALAARLLSTAGKVEFARNPYSLSLFRFSVVTPFQVRFEGSAHWKHMIVDIAGSGVKNMMRQTFSTVLDAVIREDPNKLAAVITVRC